MDDILRDLYQEVILDHNKNPKNYGEIAETQHRADGYNPLCGDKLTITLRLENDRIQEVRFVGSGCAISKASASLMTTVLKDLTIAEAEDLFERFQSMLTSDPSADIDTVDLGKLAVFAGVREFPSRVKCASLAWHTLRAALHPSASEDVVTTE